VPCRVTAQVRRSTAGQGRWSMVNGRTALRLVTRYLDVLTISLVLDNLAVVDQGLSVTINRCDIDCKVLVKDRRSSIQSRGVEGRNARPRSSVTILRVERATKDIGITGRCATPTLVSLVAVPRLHRKLCRACIGSLVASRLHLDHWYGSRCVADIGRRHRKSLCRRHRSPTPGVTVTLDLDLNYRQHQTAIDSNRA